MPERTEPTPADPEAAAGALEPLLDGRDFLCSVELPAAVAAVRFLGAFHGRRVAWRMTLRALQAAGGGQPRALARGPHRSYMEIAPAPDGWYEIEVGLDVPVIDEPTIRKTLVMVRQYRRLALGRHEWGAGPP